MIWDKLLTDPSTGQFATIDVEQSRISNINTDLFQAHFEGNIPLILPKKAIPELANSAFHQQTNSQFDYLDHYQKDAKAFDYFLEYESPVTRDEINRLHQKIVDHVPKNAGLVLDVGCGNGWLSQALINNHRKVISMDISLTNPEKALKNLTHPNHFGLVADVFHLPIAEETIDCVVASEIMEHVPDPATFIQNLLRPLKKGGKLIITTPYNERIEYHLCVHCNQPTPVNAHLHSFNEQNIRQLIPKTISNWRHYTFANKYAAKIRLYLLISNLPFSLWKSFDMVINKLVPSPTRLLIEIKK